MQYLRDWANTGAGVEKQQKKQPHSAPGPEITCFSSQLWLHKPLPFFNLLIGAQVLLCARHEAECFPYFILYNTHNSVT